MSALDSIKAKLEQLDRALNELDGKLSDLETDFI